MVSRLELFEAMHEVTPPVDSTDVGVANRPAQAQHPEATRDHGEM
jgi:hypothetical protein